MSYWPAPRTLRLREMVVDPVWRSAAQMAVVLNNEFGLGLTRNAVIGKINRKRWAKDRTPRVFERAPRPPRQLHPRNGVTAFNGFNSKKVEPPKPLPVIAARERRTPRRQRCELVELNGHTCRFPVGDPLGPGFFFCGAQPVDDQHPYCAPHCRVAYSEPMRRRR
jgi:GcrA cell cycle regulator